jgi:signal transduction histidine kinase/ligand-binding sensor domain-containing protein/CheY-like chemotaxis protein
MIGELIKSFLIILHMQLNFRVFIALLIFLSVSGTGVSQTTNLQFNHLSVEQGLSQGNVWEIHQGKLGFIWIGTEDGLNMYDGYSFKVFKNNPLDTSSLCNNNIRSIAENADGNLWIGTRGGLDFYNRGKDRFEHFLYDKKVPGSLSNNLVDCIFLDSNGNLWVGTENGLNLYDAETKTFRHFFHETDNPRSLISNSIRAIAEDSDGQIWVGTTDGLSQLNRDGKTFTHFLHRPHDPSTLSSNVITSLLFDKNKTLWVGTFDGGLNRKESSQNSFVRYVHNEADKNSISNNLVYELTEDSEGILWIGTDRGLIKMDKKTESFSCYVSNPEDKYSISNNTINKIKFDVNDRMWLGTRFGGVNVYDKNKYAFDHYQYHSYDKNSLSHNVVSCFKEDVNGNFWVATDGGGLNYFERKSGKFTAYLNKFTNNKILAMEKDLNGGLWLGMWQGGVNYFNPATGKIKRYLHDPSNPGSLSDNNIFYILCDRKGNIWVATWGDGLNKYNPETDDFTRMVHDPDNQNSISSSGIDYLFEDSEGKLWIGTELSGVDRFDPETNTFTHYQEGLEKGSLTGNFVSAIFEDSRKRIWIGTYGGLNLFDPKNGNFKAYREHDGLLNDAIVGIQEDGNGKLWLSTNKGISCFDPERKTFKNFTVNDGLQGNQFTRWASSKLASGELLFGGTNGFTLFHPDSIRINTYKPPVYITEFKVSNKLATVGENGILKKNIMYTSEIELSYLDNIFSFEFAALNYRQPEKNRYRYKMEGFQEEWVDAEEERRATYTNLSPGEYTFHVIASNNDGVWNEKGTSVKIIITPPYWKKWWFLTIITFAVLGSIVSFVFIRINTAKKLKRNLEEKIRQSTAEITGQKEALEAQAENMQTLNDQLRGQTDFLQQINEELQQQREQAEKAKGEAEKANQAKSIFLATMSHEIRTPMNGVLGMASLLAETTLTTEQKEYTDTIRGSGEALLTVINDILDFSKIESGNLELDNHAFDLRQCVEDVMDVFSVKAAQKGLDLVYQIDNQIPAQIVSDSHRLRQILLNLMGNAMKFTHHGEIFVKIDLLKIEKDHMELAFHVRDTGIGIPQDKLSRLFKAFSQVDSSTTRKYGGTGLGLVISQRLVELMGGSIGVESEPGVGTSFGFTVKGRVGQESIRQYVNASLAGNEGKKVLVVDDNATNLIILKNQLEQWRLEPTLASSGSEALQFLAGKKKFDLVITDMQMPDMDGVQLTKLIKSRHAALPVILLSSIGDESKKKHRGLFAAVLNKPVKQQQFSRVLHSVLRPEAEVTLPEDQKPKQLLSEDFAKQYPLRILIAEDNPVNQKLTLRVLSKLGYQQIEIAHNGLEAVEKFDEQFFDVILMDVQMPEMDGLEATRMIRLKQYHQPVIISMTANAMQGDKEECIKAGMDDYISKPVKLEMLVSVLEKWAVQLKDRAIQKPVIGQL